MIVGQSAELVERIAGDGTGVGERGVVSLSDIDEIVDCRESR